MREYPYNYLLRLSFVGTNYHGWQIQPDKPTLQGTLKEALERIFNSPVKLIGCCRTDAGVHAIDYVANCKTRKFLEDYKLLRGLNSLLPPDIAVKEVKEAPPDFNARFNVLSKTYLYKIWNSPVRDPFIYPFSWHLPFELDKGLFSDVLNLLEGKHDFSGFAKLEEERDTVIELKINWELKDALIEVRLSASHFLRYMVRRIIGTAVLVGRRRLRLEDVQEFLQGKKAPYTAPAHGLHLERVYDGLRD